MGYSTITESLHAADTIQSMLSIRTEVAAAGSTVSAARAARHEDVFGGQDFMSEWAADERCA